VSPGPVPAPGGRTGRGPRNAVVAVALLVLVLVVVLAGLLRGGGSEGAGPGPGVASPSAAPSASGRAPSSRPSGPPSTAARDPESGLRVVALASLPREAQRTVRLIDAGGPFPYAKDGATFSNREGRLPREARGWYREYTVPTPGEGDRGARRIVTGDRDRLLYYTADHYDSFVSVAR
jgi:ribonuclease T1